MPVTPSVGSVACHIVKGVAPEMKSRTLMVQRSGIDGYCALLLGRGDSEFQIEAILFGSFTSVDVWTQALRALQGTVVAIEDDWGKVQENCLLVQVTQQPTTRADRLVLDEEDEPSVARGSVIIQGVVVG